MTPQEADVLRFMLRIGRPVSRQRIAGQFGLSLTYVDLVLSALKKLLLAEQDRQFFRTTSSAEKDLADSENRFKYVPFEGRPAW